jgi:hypothetical protein
MMDKITEEMSVAEALRLDPRSREVFDRHGLKGCGGENGPAESIAFFAAVHEIDPGRLLGELNQPTPDSKPAHRYEKSSADVIYRRFFKAAIVTVLSVGCMWGACSVSSGVWMATYRFMGYEIRPAILPHIEFYEPVASTRFVWANRENPSHENIISKGYCGWVR